MAVIKVGEHNEVVIPKDVCEHLGVKPGDLVNAKFELVDDVPHIDEPLGPKTQASIERGLKDLEEGRTDGPFDSAADLIERLRTKPSPSDV